MRRLLPAAAIVFSLSLPLLAHPGIDVQIADLTERIAATGQQHGVVRLGVGQHPADRPSAIGHQVALSWAIESVQYLVSDSKRELAVESPT